MPLATNHSTPTFLARTLSLLLHPMTMVLWMSFVAVFGFVGRLTYPSSIRWYVVGTVAFMTIFIPCLFLWLMRLFGGTKREQATARHGRIMVLVALAVCYTCCGWVFDNVVVLYLVRKMLYTATSVVVLLLVFELFYPLSYHTTAMGALLGMMWALLMVGNTTLLIPFIVGVMAAGLLATSRIYLHGYSLGRVVWGLLLGFVLGAVMLVVI